VNWQNKKTMSFGEILCIYKNDPIEKLAGGYRKLAEK